MNIRSLYTRACARAQRVVERTWLELTSPRIVSAQTLSEKAFLARFDLDGEAPSREALLAHYARRSAPGWPAPPPRIRDLRINTGELGQEELVALANDILDHRFVLRLNAPKVTAAGRIDWHFNPTPDREWHWALNRHQWWPVLGLAYAKTGDERYATAFVSQMLDWVENNPPPVRKDEGSPAWRLMETGLRMRISWIPCFGLFYDSPAFTDEAKLTMLRSIYDHARFLFLFVSNRNHLLRESNGLAYVGAYFPEFKEASRWLQVAFTRLDNALVEQINQDGSHIEVSTGYQSLVIDEFENTHALLRANALSLPNEDLSCWLAKMYRVMAYAIRPDGSFPQVNDGSIYWDYTQLAQAGKVLGRDDLIYIGTRGDRGKAPTDTSVDFGDAGLYVMRSDWTPDARYLLFDAGPYGGPHGHEDKLSIELSAFGQPFIVDPGSYTYDRADPFRAYFVSSKGHNTILVDGKSQVRRWHENSLNPQTALGNYATWISQADFDYVSASYRDGYGTFSLEKPIEADIIQDVIHTRRILFVKPDYWVVVDELDASTPHKYQMLFHTVPEIVASFDSANTVVLSATPKAAALRIIPANPQSVRVSFLTGSTDPIQGWYSPGTCRKAPATTVIYEWESCAPIAMATLLYPCLNGKMGDDVNISPLEVSEGEGLAFVVSTGHGRDYLLFSRNEGLKQFGPYSSMGSIAGVRTDCSSVVRTRFEWKPK